MKNPVRTTVALVLLISGVTVLVSAQQLSPTLKTRNVVLIVSDGLGGGKFSPVPTPRC